MIAQTMRVDPSPQTNLLDGHEPAQRVAALVGNGLSIAYNSKLAMPALTDRILERLAAELGGDDAGQALLTLARTPDATTNFEALLGPLDDIGDLLRRFSRIASIVPDGTEASEHLDGAAAFFRAVRRLGISHTLEVIDELAVARHEEMGSVDAFLNALVELGQLTIANLNYDSLVLASLLNNHKDEVCDMKCGYDPQAQSIGGVGHPPKTGWGMRSAAELLPGGWSDGLPIRLLHLHGSLSWLRSPGRKTFGFTMDDVRQPSYWQSWRNGDTAWEPVVILTNQDRKGSAVTDHPFNLAYSAFERHLAEADRWIIAGYSFGDECVNEMLASAFHRHSEAAPAILVATKGECPTRAQILEALQHEEVPEYGPPASDFLYECRDGIEEAPGSEAWVKWLKSDGAYWTPIYDEANDEGWQEEAEEEDYRRRIEEEGSNYI